MVVVNQLRRQWNIISRTTGWFALKRVTATAVVAVVSTFAQDVIDLVLKSFERQGWAVLVSFAGVIEHDVQDHFDASSMQFLDTIVLNSFT